MKKLLVLLLAIGFIFVSCDILDNISNEPESTSELTGYAMFNNSANHSNISIEIKSNNSVVKSTITDSSGLYSVDGLVEGNYTITASSINSKEKTVHTSVLIESRNTTASDLELTAIGHISGRITIDDSASGNLGVLVFIAGTSYVAMTDDFGDFVISDVPVGNNYSVVISKDGYMIVWDTVNVTTGNTTSLNNYSLLSTDFVGNTGDSAYDIWLSLGNEGTEQDFIDSLQGADGVDGTNGTDGINGVDGFSIIWKGSLEAHPENPEENWAYYNSIDGISYIYDGIEWSIFVMDGVDGENGLDGQDGFSIIWKGSLEAHPENPGINWAYYNSFDGISYIYDGTEWTILAQDGLDGENGLDGEDGLSLLWQGTLESHPVNPEANWTYYNSIDGISYIYDGTEWTILAQDGLDGENGLDGEDGLSLLWQGTLESHPVNPEANWAYYNSVDGISYIYDGTEWTILSQDGKDCSVIPRDGLVAEYLFNGNANDTSGNDNHGTVYGASLTTDRDGNADSAYSFDGVDDWIEIANSSNFNISDNSIWTINLNMKSNLTSYGCLINNYDSTSKGWGVGLRDNGKINGRLESGPNSSPRTGSHNLTTVSNGYNNNEWININVVFDGAADNSNESMKFYINGVKVDSEVFSSDWYNPNLSYDTLSNIIIGKAFTTSSWGFYSGVIDDIRIYNRELTDAEALSLYSKTTTTNTNSTIPRDGLVAEFLFNGDANDKSGNDNHGTVNGATLTVDRDGNVDSAYSFDGIDDYITIDSTLNIGSVNEAYSINVWIKINHYPSSGNVYYLLGDYWGSYDQTFSSNLTISEETNQITFAKRFDGNIFSVSNEVATTIDEWICITVVSSISGHVKLYVNGAMVDSQEYDTSNNYFENPIWRIGQNNFSNSNYNGIIDDIRIYNRELNEDEIINLYQN